MISDATKRDLRIFAIFAGVFLAFYFIPLEDGRVVSAATEALHLARDYAREHVILCLLPALWIAGAVGAFVSRDAVIEYLGPKARRTTAYGVASVSGTILAVCSCTVLPLFAGIWRMGAGLGPATTFLYSGPAINVLAIVLTARVLGLELGVARGVAAVAFSIVLGLAMAWLFRRETVPSAPPTAAGTVERGERPLGRTAAMLGAMIAVLVFANWAEPRGAGGLFAAVYSAKWPITATAGILLAGMAWRWLGVPAWRLALVAAAVAVLALGLPAHPEAAVLAAVLGLAFCTAGQPGEAGEWYEQTTGFAKQILPLLAGGVLLAGFLFGRPGHEALIPSSWVEGAVGGNGLLATFVASVSGALMYFATLTEIPILEGLRGAGMGKGPALALLLAGPALSLPSILVLSSILGWKKTLTFSLLVVFLATAAGWAYGSVAGASP